MTQVEIIAAFFAQFTRDTLYDTGWGEPARSSGAASSDADPSDMSRSLSYLKGYADAVMLACPYMTRSWRIAQLIGSVAATLAIRLEEDGEASSTARVTSRLCDVWTRDFADLAARKEDGLPSAPLPSE